MRLEINRVEGLRNDLLLQLERAEIADALLSLPHRDRLMHLPGIPRHRDATTGEARGLAACRVPIDDHLQRLGLLDPERRPARRSVAISNRNLGTNHGHVAWQRSERPRAFRITEDPCHYPLHSCLVARSNGRLSIEDLRFDFAADRLYEAGTGREIGDEVGWATFGQRVLRDGSVARAEDIGDQFYDIRHVLAFEPHRPEGAETGRAIYRGYPRTFRENVRRAWLDHGVPRARYVHNAIGLSSSAIWILQREGTIEEIGTALALAGADDGVILDNGGSVVCWAWWTNNYAGGIISPTVDYRPDGTSAIAFVLRGPVKVEIPGGSISPTVL